MTAEILNSDDYIDMVLSRPEFENQPRYLRLSLWINFQSLFYSRRWLLYLLIGLFPLLFTLFTDDKLLGSPDAASAYVTSIVDSFFLFLFTFGCLLIAQPLSTDEISDHFIELYLVRPIRRETIWISRWIIANIFVWLVNAMIITIYFIFYHIVDPNGSFSDVVDNLDLLFIGYFVVLLATIIYSGIFLFVGFIGNRGFSLGVMIAVIEAFFLDLLFLANSEYMPKTHVKHFLGEYFEDYYVYNELPTTVSLTDSYLYVLAFALVSFIIGLWYLRRRQFN